MTHVELLRYYENYETNYFKKPIDERGIGKAFVVVTNGTVDPDINHWIRLTCVVDRETLVRNQKENLNDFKVSVVSSWPDGEFGFKTIAQFEKWFIDNPTWTSHIVSLELPRNNDLTCD